MTRSEYTGTGKLARKTENCFAAVADQGVTEHTHLYGRLLGITAYRDHEPSTGAEVTGLRFGASAANDWGAREYRAGAFPLRSGMAMQRDTRVVGANGSGGGLTYASAGIDLEAKDRFTESLDSVMRRTFTRRVIPNPGGFAGLVRLDYNERLFKRNYRDPVLVACADGVGTKIKIAAAVGDYSTIGIDCVAMNVNDMIVQGAEPLLFLDYLGVHRVEPGGLSELVRGVAEGCRIAGCSLIGGETAEMPDIYPPGELDLAGFAVGVVELERTTSPLRVRPGDVVLGLASDGVHSNGFTLVRKIVTEAGLDLGRVYEELDDSPRPTGKGKRKGRGSNGAQPRTLGRVLLTPTRIYAAPIVKLQRDYKVKKVISGMAHITGSGMVGNLCRALNPKVDAVVDKSSWPVPAVFSFLQKHGRVPEDEMRRVFNMGIGYCLVVRPDFADSIAQRLRRLGERVYRIGKIVKGTGQVREE